MASRHKDRFLLALSEFSSCLCNGGFPPPASELLAAAKLFALGKKTGGVRPIACGDTFRRVAAKCLLQTAISSPLSHLLPTQMGVKVANATEIIARETSLWMENYKDGEVMIQIDLCNAFNSIHRKKMMDAVFKYALLFTPTHFHSPDRDRSCAVTLSSCGPSKGYNRATCVAPCSLLSGYMTQF